MAAWTDVGSPRRAPTAAAPRASRSRASSRPDDAVLGAAPSGTDGDEIVRSMVLWCPDWPVTAVVAGGLAGADDPVALVAAGVVFASSPAARAAGVVRGLRMREAQARCPSVVVLPYDHGHDVRAFEPVLAAVETIMPGVAAVRPGLVALRARGPARYYGGERAAAAALVLLAREHGVLGARVGVADGPFAAEQAARRGPASGIPGVAIVPPGGSAEFLGPMPVDVLGDAAFADLLRRLGLRRVGDLTRLGRDQLRDRFGAAGARAHALATGEDVGRVLARTPSVELERTVHFEPGLDRVDQVTFGFRAAADELVATLTALELVATAIVVEVTSESGAVSERSWLHPHWFTSADVVDRVRWQLQGTGTSDSGLDSPVVTVSVRPETVDPAGDHEAGLWGGGPDERIHHGLSRVQSMLGHEAVVTPVVGGGRMLADRRVLVPWGARREPRADDAAPWPGSLPSPLPATVFDPHRPAEVHGPGGAPVAVDARGTLTAPPDTVVVPGSRTVRGVRSWAGPWPVADRWWDADAAHDVQRVHVVDDTGTAWLLVLDGASWWAEARYD